MPNEILTPTEVAQLLAVSPVTVRQWAQKGLIQARTTPGGHRRFTRDAIIDFARRMAMPLPDDFVSSAGIRVLVVDVDRPLVDALVVLFKQRSANVEVACAFDAFEAGRLVSRLKPTLIQLDITMAGIDGVAVCRTLKADVTGVPARIVAMAVQPTRELEEQIIGAGAVHVLKKPFSNADLIAACALT